LSIIIAENALTLSDLPDESIPIMAYNLGPDGAYFNPPLKLSLDYSEENLPGNVSEKDLYLTYYDGKQWCILKSEIDFKTKSVSAEITHFSTYALIGKVYSIEEPITPPSITSGLESIPTVTAIVVTPQPIEANTAGKLAAMAGVEQASPSQAETAKPEFEQNPPPLQDWLVMLLIAIVIIATIAGIIIVIRIRYRRDKA
jgi:hypothetical protein